MTDPRDPSISFVTITAACVPDYLRGSDFYNALMLDDEKELTVPKVHFKQDCSVANMDDLRSLLSTMHFWGVSAFLPSVADFLFSCEDSSCMVVVAMYEQDMPFLSTLRRLKEAIDTERIKAAILDESVDILAYLSEHRYSFGDDVCEIAAGLTTSACLQFLHEKGCSWTESTCIAAAFHGSISCLRYAHTNGCPWSEDTCTTAADHGALNCLIYAHEQGCPWDENTCTYAALNGHLECLKYAHSHDCPWDGDTAAYAASNGHLHCLQYLHENGCSWDSNVCAFAAAGGHLNCLIYAHEHTCSWEESTCSCAAEKGHLDCLKYALQQGCPSGEATLCAAASGGHVEILQYLHGSAGYPWTEKVLKIARRLNHTECLHYALENGCPTGADDFDASAESSAGGGNIEKQYSCMYTCM